MDRVLYFCWNCSHRNSNHYSSCFDHTFHSSEILLTPTETKKYGCFWWGLVTSIVLIILVVIAGVIVFIYTGNAAIEIGVILGVLILVGLLAIMFIELQRKKAAARRKQSTQARSTTVIQRVQKNNTPLPSAPPRSTQSSWIRSPWRKSSSSRSTPTIYHEVARDDRQQPNL